MPSFPSSSLPITTYPIDDSRSTLNGQAPLSSSSPPTYKTSPVVVPAKPIAVPKVDSGPPPVNKESVGNNHQDEAIDRDVFDQILDLDEDGELFSKDMVDAYYVQADKTFADMDAALAKKDLAELSSLGHFLKGSSAALGMSKVQSSCEDIQYYGQLRDGKAVISEAEALLKIATALARARVEHIEAKNWLEAFFETYTGEED